jgi:UDP-glucose 4-epimerase
LDPIVYGDGQQTRCFSDVRDVAPVFGKLATDERVNKEVFNVGPDEQVVTIEELGRRLAMVAGKEWTPIRLEKRPLEVAHAFCSSDKIREWFGYKTGYTLDETLEALVEYVRVSRPRHFSFYLPVEIITEKTPKFWTQEVL